MSELSRGTVPSRIWTETVSGLLVATPLTRFGSAGRQPTQMSKAHVTACAYVFIFSCRTNEFRRLISVMQMNKSAANII
jgi:hypothetical protein